MSQAHVDDDVHVADPEKPARGPGVRVEVLAVATLVLLALVAVAGLVGYGLAGSGTPSDESADAGFARDMQVHHHQAVEMAMVIRDSSQDPAIRSIAYDIATSQSQQSGQMYGWLSSWGLSQAGSEPAMAWMSGSEHGHGGGTAATSGTAGMPGMATPDQLTQLRSATGVEAERLFLQLMIAHHRGGVEMAEAALDRADRPEVRQLARAIITAQQAEIATMSTMLEERS